MSSGRTYSEDDKYKAVCLYYLYHNFKEVERQTGIPYTTIRSWQEQEWWPAMMEQAMKELRAKIRGRGHELIDLAITAVKDRLENGDVILDKRNNQVRKPVALKDALLVSLTWMDKTMKIDADEGIVKESPTLLKDIAKDLEAIGKRVGAGDKIQKQVERAVEALPEIMDKANDGNS